MGGRRYWFKEKETPAREEQRQETQDDEPVTEEIQDVDSATEDVQAMQEVSLEESRDEEIPAL